jgi:hypothetical protein
MGEMNQMRPGDITFPSRFLLQYIVAQKSLVGSHTVHIDSHGYQDRVGVVRLVT